LAAQEEDKLMPINKKCLHFAYGFLVLGLSEEKIKPRRSVRRGFMSSKFIDAPGVSRPVTEGNWDEGKIS
jgi:hypothetical protein